MTMSALDIGMRADALVQLMKSEAPLDSAKGLLTGATTADVEAIAEAFKRRGWLDDDLPVTDRGARLHDWLLGLQADP